MGALNKPVEIDEFISSDEEDIRNTIGNVPLQWYLNFAHIGYDTSGRKICKPGYSEDSANNLDPETLKSLAELENILQKGESALDPVTKRPMIKDPLTGQMVVLSEADLSLLHSVAYGEKSGLGNLHSGYKVGTTDADGEEWFAWADETETWDPTIAAPLTKRKFLPSKYDRKRIGRMVHAIKMGWMLPVEEKEITEKGPAELEVALEKEEQPDCLPDSVVQSDGSLLFPDIWTEVKNDDDEMDDGFRIKHDPLRPPPPPRVNAYLRPPEEPLPGHELSYRPPLEYLLTPEEIIQAKKNRKPHSKAKPLIPNLYKWLRHIPWNSNYIYERFDRCRDLIMASRFVQSRVNVHPDDMLPKMPSLADMRPFPTKLGLVYKCEKPVCSVSISPDGLFVACGTVHGHLLIFEMNSPRCFRNYKLDDTVDGSKKRTFVAWNLDGGSLHLIAAACGDTVHIINPMLDDHQICNSTDMFTDEWIAAKKESVLLEDANNHQSAQDAMETSDNEEEDAPRDTKRARLSQPSGTMQSVTWKVVNKPTSVANKLQLEGRRIVIHIQGSRKKSVVSRLHWHNNGRYLLTVDDSEGVVLHHLSKMRSQRSFVPKGDPQITEALFHPRPQEPSLLVSDKRHVRQLCLRERKTLKNLNPGLECVTCMVMHPSGLHLVVGSVEGQIDWFDLEMGQYPYKKLSLKQGSVRSLAIHPRRPLLAVGTMNGSIVIFHTKVPQDFTENVAIHPVQVLRGHKPQQTASEHGCAEGILDCAFHPLQPFVFSAGCDGNVRQFVPNH